MIDTAAGLLKAGLLTTTDIEDASEHDLLAAGLSREQIRRLRHLFVYREAFGLPDRGKPKKNRLHVCFGSAPRMTAATSPTVPSESPVPKSASKVFLPGTSRTSPAAPP